MDLIWDMMNIADASTVDLLAHKVRAEQNRSTYPDIEIDDKEQLVELARAANERLISLINKELVRREE